MRATKESGKILQEYVELAKKLGKFPTAHEVQQTITSERQVKNHFGSFSKLKELASKNFPEFGALPTLNKEPKILIFDIETFSMTVEAWGLRDQNFGLNQIVEDGYVVAWAAKWLNDPPSKVMYMDQSKVKYKMDNRKLIKEIAKLLDEADIIVSQNGIRFDSKWINTEIENHDLNKPSSYRHHDLYRIAKKYLNLPSYKLEYMSNKFNKKYKKLKHKNFPGHDLWRECRKGNKKAWEEMKTYNIHDVLATEELYNRFKKWFFRKYS
jgi:DNA polymerase elongation subunit (family B)